MGNELETSFNELSKLFQLKSTYRKIYRAIHLIRLRQQQQQLRNYTPLKELINNNESSQERHWINFSFAAQHEDNFGKWLKVIDEHRHEIVPLSPSLYPLQRLSGETVAEVKQSCVIILMIVFFASLLSRLSNKSQTSYHRSVGIHISLVFMLLLKGKHTQTQAHTYTHTLSGRRHTKLQLSYHIHLECTHWRIMHACTNKWGALETKTTTTATDTTITATATPATATTTITAVNSFYHEFVATADHETGQQQQHPQPDSPSFPL